MQNQGKTWVQRPSDKSPNWRATAAPSGSNSSSTDEGDSEPSSVSSGSRTPPLPSPPFTPYTTKGVGSRRESPLALQQPNRTQSALPKPRSYDVKPGIILFFPKEVKTGSSAESSLLRNQLWVNQRATGHYVVVWDVYSLGHEQVIRCLPMTSFAETSVEGKYHSPGAWRFWLEYVPIMQHGVPMASEANMPSLALVDDRAMSHQTYVHLDHYFDVEARFLTRKPQNPVYLENDALSVLVFKFHQFVSGETRRHGATQRHKPGKNVVRSPKDYGEAPAELARPELKSEVLREKVRDGCALEAARHNEAGTREWTGKEWFGPRQQADIDLCKKRVPKV